MPRQYDRIVSQTIDLKHDINFGYAISRSEMTYNQLIGSRAYQKASEKVKADQERSMREEREQERLASGG